MNSNGEQRTDKAWPEAVQWRSGVGVPVNETIWRCAATRAGRLYQTVMFDTQAEADAFAVKMREVEPDQMFSVEAIKANTVWN